MGLIKKTQHLKRYKDLAWLFIKYGRSDVAEKMDLGEPDFLIDSSKSKAEDFPDDLEKLGPTYVKLGQFLSTRADFMPPDYMKALARLQDNVKPAPTEEIEEIITTELGARMSKIFDDFDRKPMASASIGQVHRATLRGGKTVVVKVQRPNIRELVLNDLDAFEEIAEFLERNTDLGKQLMLRTTLEEFRKAIIQELDYTREASNLEKLSQNLREFEHIIIPSPIHDYCSSRVLTMDYIKGKNVSKLSPIWQTEINGKGLAEELFRAYLKQIIIDGFYHADPHPGNVYITEEGGLALIDLGMTGRVSEKMRSSLLHLLLAVSEGNGEKAAEHILSIGTKESNVNQSELIKQISELIETNIDNPLKQIEVGRLVLEITKISRINGIKLPNEVVMLGKTLLNLDKVGRTLDKDFDPNASLRRNSMDLMQKKFRDDFTPANFFQTILTTKLFLEELPGRLNKITEKLASDKFTIRAKLIDEQFFISGLKEAANRLTIGLILAALIIGASLLMRVETSFTIIGYPGLAIIFFLLAALGGLFLVFKSLFRDRE
jgi:predicted unusual protein kinase regulating ubiquinone biosynthesis (AarF/ABC1/UbiB family)